MTKQKIQKELEKLQTEYNELHARLGYTRNPANCEAINNRLDSICEKMNALFVARETAK